jgi:Gpi18-like mannosyltransferase
MSAMRSKWVAAFKHVLPTYLVIHIMFAVMTVFSVLFLVGDFSTNALPIRSLLHAWNHWDTEHYVFVAAHGYDSPWRTAFFPLFSLLTHVGMIVVRNAFLAGIIVSNIANLLMLMVLYQLVKEDFGEEQATRAGLYLSIFPSAFFLVAAYTESLFLCLVLLSFYQMRHSRWLWAAIFAFFACLTRSSGIFLLLPWAYEYLRTHEFSWRKIRFGVLSILLIPSSLVLYSGYCYLRFGDALSWYHAQSIWNRQFHIPMATLLLGFKEIKYAPGLLSFFSLRNILDLISILFILVMITLMLVGPWRLRRGQISYVIYAVSLYLFLLSYPVAYNPVPLQSIPRYMLAIFPIFIIASNLGKHRYFHDAYLFISGSLLFFSCLLFLTGHWMT